jgi:hypothetical protein
VEGEIGSSKEQRAKSKELASNCAEQMIRAVKNVRPRAAFIDLNGLNILNGLNEK